MLIFKRINMETFWKKISVLVFVLSILPSCERESTLEKPSDKEIENGVLRGDQKQKPLVPEAEIHQFITRQLESSGDVNWSEASDELLYSAAVYGGNMITIGYGEDTTFLLPQKNQVYEEYRTQIISRAKDSSATLTILEEDRNLGNIDVPVTSLRALQKLRAYPKIRYLEPSGFQYKVPNQPGLKSSQGCTPPNDSFRNEDISLITPNALLPWNFELHNLTDAWAESTGRGVTVGIIDTGISLEQTQFTSQFRSSNGQVKQIERFGVFVDSPWFWSRKTDGVDDKCGHGSTMAGILAGPRNGSNSPVGVAYDANLISYRAVKNVLIDTYHERRGVSRAFRELADRDEVKIISMSLGWIYSIGSIRDAIRYAHSKGKLIFVAGGTSTAVTNFVGVTFPATMDETIAVTGVTDNASSLRECNTCHKGRKIDFAMVMQRDRQPDRTIPVISSVDGQSGYVGGSSAANAMAAGIAALVWSKYPNWTRSQIVQRLQESSTLYPNRNADFGFGLIDAKQATQ